MYDILILHSKSSKIYTSENIYIYSTLYLTSALSLSRLAWVLLKANVSAPPATSALATSYPIPKKITYQSKHIPDNYGQMYFSISFFRDT